MAEYIADLYVGLAVYRLPSPHNARRIMSDTQLTSTKLRTPKSAAIAGIIFSVLLIITFWLLRTSFPPQATAAGSLLTERPQTVMTALSLIPFAGIAFLWFIGVLRDRLGEREDRFFATVYFGSGLLFLAMIFTAGAVVSSIVFASTARPNHSMDAGTVLFVRNLAFDLMNIYAIKVAAVFMFSTSTVAVRTLFVPRYVAFAGYLMAAVMLFGSQYLEWGFFAFPIWVLLLSVQLLVDNFRALPAHSSSR
jgi:hypothetical protein